MSSCQPNTTKRLNYPYPETNGRNPNFIWEWLPFGSYHFEMIALFYTTVLKYIEHDASNDPNTRFISLL